LGQFCFTFLHLGQLSTIMSPINALMMLHQ
jgi:hypothetical protein